MLGLGNTAYESVPANNKAIEGLSSEPIPHWVSQTGAILTMFNDWVMVTFDAHPEYAYV